MNLPENALLFSADAKSMYTNIDTNIGIQAIKDFITSNESLLPTDFPSLLFLQILEIVMKNNVFAFKNTTWLQLSGTAMGTPTACAYATISFGHHKNSKILPRFSKYLLYYKRYIDDIFGIWLPPTANQDNTWLEFKIALNDWGNLEWIIENPTKKTIFLDLNIELLKSRITTSTFQKSLNLYLYIPPNSAHPPSCLKGLISGEVRQYWLQNSPKNFELILTKFLERLVDRGHKIQNLAPLFLDLAAALDNPILNTQPVTTSKTLYIHWPFHPNCLKRGDIRNAFKTTLQPLLDYEKMTVAISRPQNIRDKLTKAQLLPSSNQTVQELINENKQSL